MLVFVMQKLLIFATQIDISRDDAVYGIFFFKEVKKIFVWMWTTANISIKALQ